MSSDTGYSSGRRRPSNATDKPGDTDTSFTSTNSSEQGASIADRLLRFIGELSARKLEHQRNIFKSDPPNPHLEELAKLETYPNSPELQWKQANAEAQKQADRLSRHQKPPTHFVQASFKQNSPTEKVGRVWVPSDPNDNPNIDENTDIRTKHNKSTECIVRMIEDQIENTRRVFEIMASCDDRFKTTAEMGEEELKGERQSHALFALRLKGVVVCEWCEDAKRWEVYFQEPDVKTGEYLRRSGW